jgi:hypothetical protein
MKVGIVGDATRGIAWEQHLRPHNIVEQVDLCSSLNELDKVDACLLLDESENNLDSLLEAVQQGLNCFFVAKQPTNITKLEKIHRAAREAGSLVQFAQWPSLAPATRWMMDKIQKPSFIHIGKEVNRNQLIQSNSDFQNLWVDELGLCMKWVDSGIHHIEAKRITLADNHPTVVHLFLRFDNGATATIYVYAAASENRHLRIVANKNEILECNVPNQAVKHGRVSSGERLFFDKQTFDPAKSAEKAALLFLKSIQLGRETAYSSYDALQLAIQIDRVESRLRKFS